MGAQPDRRSRHGKAAEPRVLRPSMLLFVAVTAIGACTSTNPTSSNGVADRRAGMPAMTDLDVQMAERTLQFALEAEVSENSRVWRNPQSGAVGSVTPVRTYRTVSGLFCREFEETITTNGNTETYRDTACRDRQGVWRPI